MKRLILFLLFPILLAAQGTPVRHLSGSGVPSGGVASVEGTEYVDTSVSPPVLYVCTSVSIAAGPNPPAGTQTCNWITVGGGGGGSSGAFVPKGAVDPTASPYNAKFDVHWGTKPSFTNTSNVVTCTDCNFTSNDIQGRPYAVVGQIVWGTTATVDTSTANSTLTTPECVIQSVDSNTQIHMGTIGSIGTACNATATTTGTGYLLWGDLDSASSTQTQSTANDPLFAAHTAAVNACAGEAFPFGATFIEQSEWTTYNTSQTCGSNNSITSIRFGFTIKGFGPWGTIIIPTPNFLSSTCTGPNGTGNACLFSIPNLFLQGVEVFGGGNSACGAGFNGKNLINLPGFSPGINMREVNNLFFGWCANTAGTTGLLIGSGASSISGGDLYDVWVENFGINSVKTDPGTGDQIEWHGGEYWSGLGKALEVASGTFRGHGGFHGTQTAQPIVTLDASTTYFSTDDFFQNGNGNAPIISHAGSNAVSHLKGSLASLASGTTGVSCVTTLTCTTYLQDTQWLVGARVVFSDTSSTLNVFDGGNNSFTVSSPAADGAGTVNWNGNGNGDTFTAACTGTVTASLTTGGIYGTGPNIAATACNAAPNNAAPGALGIGNIAKNNGTIIHLYVTATAAGTNASSGVVTVMKNGVATTSTCTVGTGTKCSDATHFPTYVKGDLLSIQYTTQAADTLAGLKITVVAN